MRYEREFETRANRETALRFASNVLNLPIWDPSISGARKLTSGRVRCGTEFLVRFGFLGMNADLPYEVVEYEPGRRAVLRSETRWATATDIVTVESAFRGCLVRWEADIQLTRPLSALDPVLGIVFGVSVDRAVARLKESLDAIAQQHSRRLPHQARTGATAASRRRKAA